MSLWDISTPLRGDNLKYVPLGERPAAHHFKVVWASEAFSLWTCWSRLIRLEALEAYATFDYRNDFNTLSKISASVTAAGRSQFAATMTP